MAETQSLHKVVVAGASGNIGTLVVEQLLEQGFEVSVLTRAGSSTSFPPAVHVFTTDYSKESLIEILQGHDAVVSTIATASITQQREMIDAAVEAGVNRFLPSEYGIDTSRPELKDVVAMAVPKQEAVRYLRSKETSGLSWTAIIVGAWFDWGLKAGIMGYDIPTRSAHILGDGNQRYEATNFLTIAKAIVATLQHPTETANQYVYVNSFTVTQNQVVAALEKATNSKWNITHESLQAYGEAALEKIKKGGESVVPGYPSGVVEAITAAFQGFAPAGVKSLNDFEGRAKVWNKILGLPEEDLEGTVRKVIEGMS